jgi:hypothetical protein
LLKYFEAMAILESGCLEDLQTGLNILQTMRDNNPDPPAFVLFGLAKYSLRLRRPNSEIEELAMMSKNAEAADLDPYPFPGFETFLPETVCSDCRSAMADDLLQEVKVPPISTTICRLENCFEITQTELFEPR